jgi:hypothetical protein
MKFELSREEMAYVISALQFYARPSTYQTQGHPQIDSNDTPINYDSGGKARRILGRDFMQKILSEITA